MHLAEFFAQFLVTIRIHASFAILQIITLQHDFGSVGFHKELIQENSSQGTAQAPRHAAVSEKREGQTP